jgi:hypothetical protein
MKNGKLTTDNEKPVGTKIRHPDPQLHVPPVVSFELSV